MRQSHNKKLKQFKDILKYTVLHLPERPLMQSMTNLNKEQSEAKEKKAGSEGDYQHCQGINKKTLKLLKIFIYPQFLTNKEGN